LAAIVLIVISATGCTEKFFNQYPSNKISEGNFYRNADDFNQAIRGCYARLTTQLAWNLTEIAYRSDEAYLDDMTTSTQERYANDHFQEQTTAGMFEDIWQAWYSGITRCNDVLDHIEGASDIEGITTIEAEARFLRSWFYFSLYRTFGTVPLVKKVVSPAEAKLIRRCSDEEMKELLCSDLTFAGENLPESRPAEAGRVTRLCAKALLGKVLLTFGDYSEAEKVLEPIQSDNFYGLMKTTSEAFAESNKLNKEMVFFVYFDNTSGSGHGAWWTVSSLDDIKNPSEILREKYDSEKDNRYSLIAGYHKISNTNYLMNKWYTAFDSVYTTDVNSDFPHIRFADIVLMMAEALGRQGRLEEALPYLNKTRTRAGIPALTKDEVSTMDAFIRELADERCREFALEGQRWYDLVRLGLAVDYFSSLGYTIDNHHLLFPIPEEEIMIVADKSILWQNPGF